MSCRFSGVTGRKKRQEVTAPGQEMVEFTTPLKFKLLFLNFGFYMD